jgi:hypothetical protein
VQQFNSYTEPTMSSLLAFAAIHRVDRVLVFSNAGYPNAADLRSLGSAQRIGGVVVSPACGRPSLLRRDLTGVVRTYRAERRSNANIAYCVGSDLRSLPQGLSPTGDLKGASRALFVSGQGLTCAAPPAGYRRHGSATAAMNVPPGTYPLYVP